jgi:cytochrome c551/c552
MNGVRVNLDRPRASPSVSHVDSDPIQLARDKACFACHAVDKRVVGPAFQEVAARYKGQPDAEARLLDKLRKGGSGAWGSIPMPANGDLAETDARTLIRWILGDV